MTSVQRRPLQQRGGQVYFATDGEVVKIGFSTHVAGRIPRLNFRTGKKLKLIAAFDGYLEDEEMVHTLFGYLKLPLRRNRDWYPQCPEISECVDALREAGAGVTHGRPSITKVLSEKFCS